MEEWRTRMTGRPVAIRTTAAPSRSRLSCTAPARRDARAYVIIGPTAPDRQGAVMAATRFAERLNGQIANEFAASQQYIAIAIYYDAQTLPRLAAFFYQQAIEERNHALMMVQYLLDADAVVKIPGVAGPPPGLHDPIAPVA